MTGGVAEEVGEVHSNMYVINNPLPRPVISVTAPPENNITFQTGQEEMLRVAEDGFYVRGVKVEADEKEAAAVYKAFKAFLVHHALTRNSI